MHLFHSPHSSEGVNLITAAEGESSCSSATIQPFPPAYRCNKPALCEEDKWPSDVHFNLVVGLEHVGRCASLKVRLQPGINTDETTMVSLTASKSVS